MSWEWRYFAPTPLPEDGSVPLESCREDIYFPSTADAGLKLRNGTGALEVKLLTGTSQIGEHGFAERWEKDLHGGCITHLRGDRPNVDAAAVAHATRCNASELFPLSGVPSPVRVLCRKKRRHTQHGERTDCVFIAHVGGESEPLLIERYVSESVEVGSLKKTRQIVDNLEIPANATITGYPGLVVQVAQRALERRARQPHMVAPEQVGESGSEACTLCPVWEGSGDRFEQRCPLCDWE